MESLEQTWWDALLDRLYWRQARKVEPGIYETEPRRFAWVIRPLLRFDR